MSSRAALLIVAAAAILHLSVLQACILLIGYVGFAGLDQWLADRERTKVIENELWGWEIDPDDSHYEIKGNLSRVKLASEQQIVVTRIAELLKTLPR